MVDLSDYTLLLLGHRVAEFDGSFHMDDQFLSFIEDLAEPFDQVRYVCFEYFGDSETKSGFAEIDQSDILLTVDHDWASTRSPVRRLLGLREPIREIRSIDGPVVTYSFFPGVYPFLLAPVVFQNGDLNVAYFGSEAMNAARNNEASPLYNHGRMGFYWIAQRYVLEVADVAFVRDPRMLESSGSADTIESKPVSKFQSFEDWGSSSSVDSDPVTLIYVASFREVKGHRYLVEAFHTLLTEGERDYRLLLVGDGKTKPAIEQYTKELGIDHRVRFTGHIEDKALLSEQYKSADIFVHPSLGEGFPRVINEAMAFGLPVIATKTGGIPAVLSDRESALLVESENRDAIVTAVREIINDRGLREELINNGAERSDRYFEGGPARQHLRTIEAKVMDE